MKLAPIIFLLLFSIGCQQREITPGVDWQNAEEVNFAELQRVVKGKPHFDYVGSDKTFHYFRTDQGFYRLTIEIKIPELQTAVDQNVPGKHRIRVVIDNGSIKQWRRRPLETS